MSHARSLWLKFYAGLYAADLVAQERVRAAGCTRCAGGRLSVANYPRKARGLDEEAERAGQYELRLSLCCSREGCRRRATPPSVRFFGRHVFAASLVLLVMASAVVPPLAPAPSRQARRRWRSLWQERLMRSALFVEMIASRLSERIEPSGMPDTLLDRLEGHPLARVLSALRLLAPWTTASVPPESARSVMVP